MQRNDSLTNWKSTIVSQLLWWFNWQRRLSFYGDLPLSSVTIYTAPFMTCMYSVDQKS